MSSGLPRGIRPVIVKKPDGPLLRRNRAGNAALQVLAMDARSAAVQYLPVTVVNKPLCNRSRWNKETRT